MKKIEIGTDVFDCPSSWAETSMDQKVALLPLQLLGLPDDPGQAALVKYLVTARLLGAPEQLLEQLTTDQRWRLMKLSSWVFETRIESKPFDSFLFNGVEYVLPSDGFGNTSAIEMAYCNIHYMAMGRKRNPDPNAVFSIVSTLCRPRRDDAEAFRKSVAWTGDDREAYNTVLAEERAKLFQTDNLPIGLVMAVLQYFEYTNNRFLKAYKTAYEGDPGADDEAPLYPDGRGLITTFMDIAKAGVFGDFEKVCSTNAHTVWMYLVDNNLKIRRANERAERDQDD